ncbi:hypothetical protein VQL36_11605 [Chengkuizengella sp. SCS-71B]|uniref:hypothetical protein n=1 Tax=Chengkuizengella sp. SCS-71B TaxID=3115290 RepID=UPI0032C235CC
MKMINLLNQLEKLLTTKIKENALQLNVFGYYEVLLQIEELNKIINDIENYTYRLTFEKAESSGYSGGKINIFLLNDNEVPKYIYQINLSRDRIDPGVIIQKIEDMSSYKSSDHKDWWESKELFEEKYARIKRENKKSRICEINEEIKKLILEKEELQGLEFNHI